MRVQATSVSLLLTLLAFAHTAICTQQSKNVGANPKFDMNVFAKDKMAMRIMEHRLGQPVISNERLLSSAWMDDHKWLDAALREALKDFKESKPVCAPESPFKDGSEMTCDRFWQYWHKTINRDALYQTSKPIVERMIRLDRKALKLRLDVDFLHGIQDAQRMCAFEATRVGDDDFTDHIITRAFHRFVLRTVARVGKAWLAQRKPWYSACKDKSNRHGKRTREASEQQSCRAEMPLHGRTCIHANLLALFTAVPFWQPVTAPHSFFHLTQPPKQDPNQGAEVDELPALKTHRRASADLMNDH